MVSCIEIYGREMTARWLHLIETTRSGICIGHTQVRKAMLRGILSD
jgi:hypothetical protein